METVDVITGGHQQMHVVTLDRIQIGLALPILSDHPVERTAGVRGLSLNVPNRRRNSAKGRRQPAGWPT